MNISPAAYRVVAGFDRAWAIHIQRAESLLAVWMADPQAFCGDESDPRASYPAPPEGIALIPIHGVMTRAGMPCMESASTVDIRRELRSALADPNVKAIVLPVDSPGGTVAGTADLADEIAAAAKVKPVYAYVPDMACSAAYWAPSMATEVWASPNASSIGNIGVYAAVADTSEAAMAAGIKVHLLTTGPYKGMGTDGVPISADQLAEMQRTVDAQFENFLAAVAKGRKVSAEKAREWADGRWFTAPEALQMGLIDRTGSIEDLYQAISSRMAGNARSYSPPAGRYAASAPQNKPMSKLTDLLARLRGTPEAAQALGATAADIDALEAEASATATPASPVIPAEFEARIKNAESQAAAYRESIATGAAKAFSAEMVRDRRIQPEGRADAEAMLLDALRIDGSGAVALNERGELIEGEAVARVRRSYASRPQHQHGTQQIPDGDPSAPDALAPKMDEARKAAYLGATEAGIKILSEAKN